MARGALKSLKVAREGQMAGDPVGRTVPNSRWCSALLSERVVCPSFLATYGPAGLFTENSLLHLAVLFEAQCNIISQEMGGENITQKVYIPPKTHVCFKRNSH